MTRFLLITLCLLLGFVGTAKAEEAADAKTLSASVDGRQVIVDLSYASPVGSCRGWLWGAEDACPLKHIDSLKVRVGEDEIFIPRSSYADLSQPRSVEIVKDPHSRGFIVVMSGGDAAVSYRANLFFTFATIVKRTVCSGEFKEEACERTTYSFP
jgi:hypothetical protein